MRRGNWEYSLPFALNNFYGETVSSVRFANEKVNVTPILFEFNPRLGDPSGSRHLTSHPSFLGVLASGQGVANVAFDHIDMQSADIGPGSGVSCTKAFIFRATDFDCDSSRIYNMKVWASNTSDFLCPETSRIVFETSQTWKQNIALPTRYLIDKTKHLPTSQPSQGNFRRQDGGFTIHGSGDADVSEYIYVALASSGTTPLGQYGLTAASGFLIRVTYDLDNIAYLKD